MDDTRTVHRLTTKDNPFDPFDQYREWDAWDRNAGHNTNSLLGRIVITSDDLSEADQLKAIEEAIDSIIDTDVLGIYVKQSRTQQ